MPTFPKPIEVKIVGIASKPEELLMELPTIHTPLAFAQRWNRSEGKLSRIDIDLAQDVDAAAFVEEVKTWPEAKTPPLSFKTGEIQQEKTDRGLSAVEALLILGASISAISAMFIVFSTLSMGVSERSRTLAMMRAIGASKSQVATLVIGEGLLLTIAGLIIGIALGTLWVELLVTMNLDTR